MDKTIYVVTSGEYSSYSINAVFSTRDDAERYVLLHDDKYDRCRVEEFEVDRDVPHIRKDMHPYRVDMKRNGDSWVRYYHFSDTPQSLATLEVKEEYSGDMVLKGIVWARDPQHAAKIANERRAQLIAGNEWPE